MLYVSIVVFSLVVFLFLVSRKYQRASMYDLDQKNHPLKILYPCVAFFQHKVLKKEDNLIKEERLYSYKKYSFALLGLMLSLFLVFLYELQQLSKPAEIHNNMIVKPKLFEGFKKVEAFCNFDSGKKEVSLVVPEVVLQGEARTKLLDTALMELDHLILGDNTTFDFITKDLYFPSHLVQNRVLVKYKVLSLDFIQYDGRIKNENISSEGNKAYVTVNLQYDKANITKTYEFYLHQQEISTEDQLELELWLEIERATETSKYEDVLVLPEEIGNQQISWSNGVRYNSIYLFCFLVILVIMIPVLFDRNKKEKEEKYRLLLQRDYPEIVSKLQLLLNAGMTTKGAWDRIVLDYQRIKAEKLEGHKKAKKRICRIAKKYERPAYEQMLITKREQENGLSEGVSYERFGRRCKSISYIRFSSIITQNLKMGSKGLAQLLESEGRNAFEERKDQAKQLGEKASTKLLGPTIGMLVIILCIIMVPAFMAF